MGKAVIVEAIGDGLYKAKPLFNTKAIQADIARLEAEKWTYWRELNKALLHAQSLRQDRAAARETVQALIQQWKQALLDKSRPAPPITPKSADPNGNNPVTGLPYTDQEREDAMENEVVAAVNAERAARGLAPVGKSDFFSRQARERLRESTALPQDPAADPYLGMLLRLKAIDERGHDAHDRHLAVATGAVAATLSEVHAAGQTGSDDAVSAWRNDPETWDALMDPSLTQIGTGYRYAEASPATHHWNVIAAQLAPAPNNTAFFASPAGQALVADVTAFAGAERASSLQHGASAGDKGGGSGGGSWAQGWKASTLYGIGATVMGHRGEDDDCLCMCLRYGKSGTTEPRWPGPGMSIGDEEILWTVLGNLQSATSKLIKMYYL